MNFGTRGQLIDEITCVKYLVNRFRGYGVLTPPKLPFPIDLLRRPYNSVRTAVRHYDLLLSIIRPSRIGPYPSNKCVHRQRGSQTFLQITLENMDHFNHSFCGKMFIHM